MTWRRLAVVLLGIGSIAYCALAAIQTFSPMLSPVSAGFQAGLRGGHLVVMAVPQHDRRGRPNPAFEAGLLPDDRVLSVSNAEGRERRIESAADFGNSLAGIRRSEGWTLVVARRTSEGEQEVRLTVPRKDETARSFEEDAPALLIGVLFPSVAIVTALLIGLLRSEDDNALLASLLFFSFPTIAGRTSLTFSALDLRHLPLLLHTALNALLPYFFAHFFLRFPSPSLFDRKAPWLKWLFAFTAGLACLVNLSSEAVLAVSFRWYDRIPSLVEARAVEHRFGWVVLVMIAVGLVSLILNTFSAGTKNERRRMEILLAGTLGGLLPLGLLALHLSISGRRRVAPWIVILVAAAMQLFPLSFVYAIVKHRVLGMQVIVRRGLQYALVSRGFMVVEGVLIFVGFFFVAEPFLTDLFHGAWGVATSTAAVTLVAVSLLQRVNRRVMPVIDRRFFRDTYNAREVLTDLGRSVRRLAAQPETLLRRVVDAISDSMYPDYVGIFLRGATLKMSPAGDEHPALSLRIDPGARNDYRCCCYRTRPGGRLPPEDRIGSDDDLVLAAESLVARQLDRAGAEAAVVEINLDEPRSWASALAPAGSAADQGYRERQVLERLRAKLLVPLVSRERVLGFISLGEKLSEEPYSAEDRELLLTVAEQTAIALEYSQLISQVAEQERLKREMEIAKEVQQQLFPQQLPPMNSLDYTGVCRTARSVGGDYYDFIVLGPGKLGLALGDISGKGISAALLMASLQALLRSQAPARRDDLGGLLCDINRLMSESTDPSKYATFFYAVYDERGPSLSYVNAGHNPPILVRASGRTTRLTVGGTAVGMFSDVVYERDTLQLGPGDVLVIYSDGISEAASSRDEEFGEERLAEIVAANVGLSARALQDLILHTVEAFAGEEPQRDDQALVVVKVRQAAAG